MNKEYLMKIKCLDCKHVELAVDNYIYPDDLITCSGCDNTTAKVVDSLELFPDFISKVRQWRSNSEGVSRCCQ